MGFTDSDYKDTMDIMRFVNVYLVGEEYLVGEDVPRG